MFFWLWNEYKILAESGACPRLYFSMLKHLPCNPLIWCSVRFLSFAESTPSCPKCSFTFHWKVLGAVNTQRHGQFKANGKARPHIFWLLQKETEYGSPGSGEIIDHLYSGCVPGSQGLLTRGYVSGAPLAIRGDLALIWEADGCIWSSAQGTSDLPGWFICRGLISLPWVIPACFIFEYDNSIP